MRHGLFTLGLAALAACSKPNPLFLDTWEGLSEGGSQAETGATTSAPGSTSTTTGEPTTATTLVETTTAGPTATSDMTTGSDTESSGSSCTPVVLDPLPPAHDTFVAHAKDVADACTLDGANGEVFAGVQCRYMDFGAYTHLSLFRGKDFEEQPRMSAYLLDFPRDPQGQLIHGEVVPYDTIKKVSLRLAYSDPGSYGYEKAIVDLYALPAELDGETAEWVEGPGAAVKCEAGANYECALCQAGDPPTCAKKWFNQVEFTLPDDTMYKFGPFELPISTNKDGDTHEIEISRDLFGKIEHRGLVVVMAGLVKSGQTIADTPPGPLRMHAREYPKPEFRPALVVETCVP